MTENLSNKFSIFETQSATQHTELMSALDSIAYALGAPPPTPTTTLADIATLLSSLNDKLQAITDYNNNYYASSLEISGLISNNLDLMLNNNSLNAQRTIAAIYATFCPCTSDAATLAPPLDVTPTTLVDEDKCRRVQFYLALFTNWLNKIANYGSTASFVTGDVIGTLLGLAAADMGLVATGAEVGAAGGPPGIVIGAILGLIIGAIYAFGGSVLIDYATTFAGATVQDALRQGMYAANSADEGSAAFKTVIDDNFSAIPGGILNALWWASWSNDIYSGTPVVDDSAFDGTICVPVAECFTLTSWVQSTENGAYWYAFGWPGDVATSSDDGWGNHIGAEVYMIGTDLGGWTYRTNVTGHVVESMLFTGSSGGNDWTTDSFQTAPAGTTRIGFRLHQNSGEGITVELCRPS